MSKVIWCIRLTSIMPSHIYTVMPEQKPQFSDWVFRDENLVHTIWSPVHEMGKVAVVHCAEDDDYTTIIEREVPADFIVAHPDGKLKDYFREIQPADHIGIVEEGVDVFVGIGQYTQYETGLIVRHTSFYEPDTFKPRSMKNMANVTFEHEQDALCFN